MQAFKQNHPTMFQIRGQPITKPLEQSTNNNKHDTWKEQIYCPIHKHHPRINLRPNIFTFQFTTGNINPVPSQQS
jgi:hypothetical protein